MYLPGSFRIDEPARLWAFIRQHGFATLVTVDGDAPFASHLPFLADESRGVLVAHVARANPQWRHFAARREALVIFQGPHGYVSPSWYDEPRAVPTWNYAAVHAYGVARTIEEPGALLALLGQLVEGHESRFERPWRLDANDAWTRGLLDAIVGFEVSVTRLEGKFKLSQNRTEGSRRGVVEALNASGDPSDAALAALMTEVLDLPPHHD